MIAQIPGLIASAPKKLQGFEFWRKALNESFLVAGPMVDQSELPWRMLSRQYGAQVCYTPMFHSLLFSTVPKYREEHFTTCPEDRPLIAQFCGNDPKTVLDAARFVQDHCDAVDLNLGCPQGIAKKGHYGSFLQDEWGLIEKIVSNLHQNLSIPVTCKIRIFPEVEKTIRYAQMLERAGCQLLTVHGRLREQKGADTGLADWSYIKAVKDNVKIPVYANGNILCYDDILRCMKETGVDGVMTAEGYLHNPTIFNRDAKNVPVWKVAQEYLDYCGKYPTHHSNMKAHLFKLLLKSVAVHTDLRDQLARCRSVEDIKVFNVAIRERLQKDAAEYEATANAYAENEPTPHFVCQVYVRQDRLDKTIQKQQKEASEAGEADSCKKRGAEETAECCDQSEKRAKIEADA
eukprot:TRINITY_DN2879_c0_g1_i1.p1 TRINITY_DN2879_c0_g1~~TRINITY_DN2879_c0_g1_i1.p1  ORF type:complete len:425 (-),score=130.51 TRINITY_DN2879_c0_g1_i1:45-1256(-)